jgi:cytosine/adenosine deaminase-related metal-dependent hydrolase
MKRFSAQCVITNTGIPLKRAVVTTENDGTIVTVENTSGDLKEENITEYYNGIIIPGFVNCHCHLELSHMKGSVTTGKGLGGFIAHIRNKRESSKELILRSSFSADNYMYRSGTVLCADICNTSDTFNLKKNSKIKYLNLIEVFGLDPERANKRLNEAKKVAGSAIENGLAYSLVPHSVYSMSLTLLRLLRNKSLENRVTSIHFMETPDEKSFLADRTGTLMSTYEQSGLLPKHLETSENHEDAILNEITPSGNLILVHNTFTGRETINKLRERKNIYYCLCPNSNLYIENKLPPVNLLIEEGCDIVTGTDSLASNTSLSILEELKTLQLNFPDITLEELISWATINGAHALASDDIFGTIEPGKKPGLLVLENVDLQNMKLLPGSTVTRLI